MINATAAEAIVNNTRPQKMPNAIAEIEQP